LYPSKIAQKDEKGINSFASSFFINKLGEICLIQIIVRMEIELEDESRKAFLCLLSSPKEFQ